MIKLLHVLFMSICMAVCITPSYSSLSSDKQPMDNIQYKCFNSKQYRWENCNTNDVEPVKNAIQTIEQNAVGKKLINTINEYVTKLNKKLNKKIPIVFMCGPDGNTEFTPSNYGNSKELSISVNYKANQPFECVGSKIFEVVGCKERVRQVFFDTTTLDEDLFHELLHMKHFLEEQLEIAKSEEEILKETNINSINESLKSNDLNNDTNNLIMLYAKLKNSKAVNISPYDINKIKPDLFPEMKERNVTYIPWSTIEERRTVCGPDINGLTENRYRASKGRPLRYIYQGSDVCFYEPDSVIQEVFKQSIDGYGEQSNNDNTVKYNNNETNYYSNKPNDNFNNPCWEYTVSSIRSHLYSKGKFINENIKEIKQNENINEPLELNKNK